MALVVETGAGLPNANSFSDVAAADAWFADLSDTAWAALTTADKERFLIAGTEYVNSGLLWPYTGTRETAVQALEWPRAGAFYWGGSPTIPNAYVPREIQKAAWVAAGMARDGTLPAMPGAGSGGASNVKKEKVDVLEVEYFSPKDMNSSGSAGVPGADALVAYGAPAISGILMPILNQDTLSAAQVDGTGVPRSQAARRGAWYTPQKSVPSFNKGQMDAVPLAEDVIMNTRSEASRDQLP